MSPSPPGLSRREREIMELLYRFDGAAAAEVARHLPDPPSYSAVRALLSILVDKGHVKTERGEGRYIYRPRVPRARAQKSALRDLVRTFFQGSPKEAVVALLDETTLSEEDLRELRQRLDEALKPPR